MTSYKQIKSIELNEQAGEFLLRTGEYEGAVCARYHFQSGLFLKCYGMQEELIDNERLVYFKSSQAFFDKGRIVCAMFKDSNGVRSEMVFGLWRGAAVEIHRWTYSLNRTLRLAKTKAKSVAYDKPSVL